MTQDGSLRDDSVTSALRKSIPLVNYANILTLIRLLLVPIFAVTVFSETVTPSKWWIASGIFLVATITDFLDGVIARRFNLVTDFGKIADPIADKALIGTALIALSVQSIVPWWITVVIILREIFITLLRIRVLRHGVIPASRGGKVKTFSQSIAIFFYLLPLDGFVNNLADPLMYFAVVLTVATGIDYVVQARILVTRNRTDS